MKKKLILMINLVVILLFTSCRPKMGPTDNRPTDDISRVIKEAVENDFGFMQINYIGPKSDIPEYAFEIRTFDSMAIGNFTRTFQSNIDVGSKSTALTAYYCSYPGAHSGMFELLYCGEDVEDEEKRHSFILCIWDADKEFATDVICNPELYSEIEDIRELHVGKEIQDIADEKGIDWYSYWPKLETVVVEDNH